PLLVGIGLDAGEAVRVNGGYRGGALNLAARLCSHAKAGEVLVSQGIVHLARNVDGVVLHDHGSVGLKGLGEPVRVFRAAPADGGPAFVVLDDLESASADELDAALEHASRAHDTTTLVVAAFDDEHASPELLAAVRRIAGEERVLRPQPLGFDEIRSIAALYLGAAVDALPSGLLASSGGVPRRVQAQV